jgi:hypothetical protein
MTSRIPSNTPHTSESERKIPLKRSNTKSAETEGKISVRDQRKTTAQPSTAAKPSSTNKPNLNDDYSPGDASNSYGDYPPGFIG